MSINPTQKSNRILLLGASGFIGNVLYKELLSYYDVYGTYASQEGNFKDNQVFYHYSVEDGGLDAILATLQPNIIISALRGDFEAQLEAHRLLVSYCFGTHAKLLLLSSVNVFDGLGKFPSYENDKPRAESKYGLFKIALEKIVQELPEEQYSILRLPIVLGVNAPRIFQLKQAIKHSASFEVYPNLIVSAITADKVAQQVHYIINKGLYGIFHLTSNDVIHHDDLFQEIAEKISDKKPIFKSVFQSNDERYLALLPKKNKLPKNYQIQISEVIEDSTLRDEIDTFKASL
ncbi:sugar nucleotide-binding protein [Aureisphaera galaxeae]|uniref:sugar nucleotide-binding protein n=1 Tax=Aureisphaera galaxeae TaxID=1538023 RepID=UPI00234FF3CE|nr:sugar nucleotide-binding protein [Aureisphaera galaxeae]MDC8004121.1 sugar nucleotide-binding protein [Aureisphaera galaxeae]